MRLENCYYLLLLKENEVDSKHFTIHAPIYRFEPCITLLLAVYFIRGTSLSVLIQRRLLFVKKYVGSYK